MMYAGALLLFSLLFWLFCVIRNHFFIKKIGVLLGKDIELTTKSLGVRQFHITRIEYFPMDDDRNYIWWSLTTQARITFDLIGDETPSSTIIFTFANIYSWKGNMNEIAQIIDYLLEEKPL